MATRPVLAAMQLDSIVPEFIQLVPVWLQVSVDLFVLTKSQSVDLASTAQLCATTAGQLYHYSPFTSPADDDQLYNDLRWNVQRPQVWNLDSIVQRIV